MPPSRMTCGVAGSVRLLAQNLGGAMSVYLAGMLPLKPHAQLSAVLNMPPSSKAAF